MKIIDTPYFFAVFFMYMGKDRIFAYFKRSIVK